MKKLSAIISALLLITVLLALPVSAATMTPSGDTYLSSDPDVPYNPNDTMVWFEDGTACYQWFSSDPDEIEITENSLTHLSGQWYDFVFCDIGSTPEMFPAEVSGILALIKRGESTFTVKTENAKNAGAIGAIVCNNYPDGEVHDDGVISTYNDVQMTIEYPTIPCGSISSDIGAKLIEQGKGKVFIGTQAQYDGYFAEIKAAEEAAAAELAAAEAAIAEATAAAAAPQTADVSAIMLIPAILSLAGVFIAGKKR
ncbi:MAG: hypothetical protein PHZ09_09295 [Eubacteriales bacterium]|nr:hypothetical protein [Eubacteriales bacterium]